MKKKLFLLSLLSVGVLTACSGRKNDDIVNFAMPTGVPSLAMLKQMKEKDNIIRNYKVVYEIEADPVALNTRVFTGDVEVAIVPSATAANVYNMNGNYQIVGTIGFGSLYFVSTDASFASIADLSGKTICAFGKNTTPEITANMVLDAHNSTATLNANYQLSDLGSKLNSGDCEYALVAEPVLTSLKNNGIIKGAKLGLNDLYKEKDSSNELGFPQSTLIANTEFIEKNEVFINELMTSINNSIEWIHDVENVTEVKAYADEMNKIGIASAIIPSVLSRANLNFVAAEEMTSVYTNYYTKIYNMSEDARKTIGGSVPNEEIYYKAKKPSKIIN